MNITILCSDPRHPVVADLKMWAHKMIINGHNVFLVFDISHLNGGDILFLVSCSQILSNTHRNKYKVVLVLHASDLPKGRGWSPHIWSILGGANKITISLIEATEPVDCGAVWLKTTFSLEGHELLDEINSKLFEAELYLMSEVVDQLHHIRPSIQVGEAGAYMKKRVPADSKIDISKSIEEQFNLLRVVDSERFPAFFDYQGHRYLIKIMKAKNE
jgi:methionyl-tRNA formyltransferase